MGERSLLLGRGLVDLLCVKPSVRWAVLEAPRARRVAGILNVGRVVCRRFGVRGDKVELCRLALELWSCLSFFCRA